MEFNYDTLSEFVDNTIPELKAIPMIQKPLFYLIEDITNKASSDIIEIFEKSLYKLAFNEINETKIIMSHYLVSIKRHMELIIYLLQEYSNIYANGKDVELAISISGSLANNTRPIIDTLIKLLDFVDNKERVQSMLKYVAGLEGIIASIRITAQVENNSNTRITSKSKHG